MYDTITVKIDVWYEARHVAHNPTQLRQTGRRGVQRQAKGPSDYNKLFFLMSRQPRRREEGFRTLSPLTGRHLYQKLQFNSGIERQLGCAQRCPRVTPGLTEYL
jgi:hypothetical protein